MPNWCENIVTFKGSKEQIEKLKNATDGGILGVLVPRPASEEDNWYQWNVSSWGTKWEVNAEVIEEGDGWIKFSFDSAWAPPIAAYEAAEEQGITVDAMYYEPGMNFCGRFEDGYDDMFEIPATSQETRDEIPEDINEAFNVADNQEMWEDEENDE
jgi:hypothetical protein